MSQLSRARRIAVAAVYGGGGVGAAGALFTRVLIGQALAPRHTIGALLAAGLAEQLRRPVQLRCFAVVGAESAELPPQVERAIAMHPDLAVIMVGGNDVTHRRRVA